MEEDKDQIKSMEVELEVHDNPTENSLYKKGEVVPVSIGCLEQRKKCAHKKVCV